jgi:predicted transposase/invertase (TIGR01784 family)
MAAIRKVEDLSTDPNFIGYYDIEEARRQDLEDMKNTGIRIGMERGVEKGIEQGVEQNKIEIAKNLLNMNLSIEQIKEATGLEIDEIKSLM